MGLGHFFYKDEEKIKKFLEEDSLIFYPRLRCVWFPILMFSAVFSLTLSKIILPLLEQPNINYINLLLAAFLAIISIYIVIVEVVKLMPDRGVLKISKDNVEILNFLKPKKYEWHDIEKFEVEEFGVANRLKIYIRTNSGLESIFFTGYKYHELHNYELAILLNLWKEKVKNSLNTPRKST